MKWSELSEIQKNALVCEKIFGWQWIPYTYYDAAPPDGQLWLLPDGQSVSKLTPGEWTYYLDEPEVYPEGSPFPLPHKDNRHLPYWIPDYSTSMDAVWSIVEKLAERELFVNFEMHYLKKDRRYDFDRINVNFCFRNTVNTDRYPYRHASAAPENLASMPEAICKAALIAVGVEIEIEQ